MQQPNTVRGHSVVNQLTGFPACHLLQGMVASWGCIGTAEVLSTCGSGGFLQPSLLVANKMLPGTFQRQQLDRLTPSLGAPAFRPLPSSVPRGELFHLLHISQQEGMKIMK